MSSLPENVHVFDFKEKGEITDKSYDGQFTCLCILNMLEKQLLGVEKTRLQADMSNPTPDLQGIAMILSNLRVRIIDGPEWWKQSAGGGTIRDENVLVALYDKVMEAEAVWRKKLKSQAESAPVPEKADEEKKD